MKVKQLTVKQEAFCAAYVRNGGIGSDAYRAAYNAGKMADNTIGRRAYELLAIKAVSAKIAELRAAAMELAVIEEALFLAETAWLARSDVGLLFDEHGNLKPLRDLPRSVRASIASIEVEEEQQSEVKDDATVTRTRTAIKKIKLWDKNSALEKMLKHLGSFERDNKQRAGIFDKVPKDEVDRIVEYLRARSQPGDGVAGPPVTSNASRFTH